MVMISGGKRRIFNEVLNNGFQFADILAPLFLKFDIPFKLFGVVGCPHGRLYPELPEQVLEIVRLSEVLLGVHVLHCLERRFIRHLHVERHALLKLDLPEKQIDRLAERQPQGP